MRTGPVPSQTPINVESRMQHIKTARADLAQTGPSVHAAAATVGVDLRPRRQFMPQPACPADPKRCASRKQKAPQKHGKMEDRKGGSGPSRSPMQSRASGAPCHPARPSAATAVRRRRGGGGERRPTVTFHQRARRGDPSGGWVLGFKGFKGLVRGSCRG